MKGSCWDRQGYFQSACHSSKLVLQVLHQPRELIWLKGGKDLSTLLNRSVLCESRAHGDDESEEKPLTVARYWDRRSRLPWTEAVAALASGRQERSFQYCTHTAWELQRVLRAYSSMPS